MADRTGILERENPRYDSVARSLFHIAVPIALVLLCLVFIPVSLFDHSLFLFMNGLHFPALDHVWLGLTSMADGLVVAVILGAFLVGNPRVSALGLLIFPVAGILTHVIKGIFPSLRPAAVMDTVHVVGPLLRSGAFPSGHAASAVAAGLAVAYYCSSRQAGAAILLLAFLIAFSRVFVGAHFPTDVMGGIILALAVFYVIVVLAWPRWEPEIPEEPCFSSPVFRRILYVEIVAAFFVLLVYAPFLSDSPLFTSAVAAGVLAILGWGWLCRNVSRDSS
jgi:membrane-associated phospholipid phosphatase